MPPTCTICRHPKRKAIEKALLEGAPTRNIAARFGTSSASIARHKLHVGAQLQKAREKRDISSGASLLEKVEQLELDARRLTDTAEKSGDMRTALAGVREIMRITEMLAKMQGELVEKRQVEVVDVTKLSLDELEAIVRGERS